MLNEDVHIFKDQVGYFSKKVALAGCKDFEFSPGMQPNSLLPYIHIYLSIFRFVIN